MGEEIKVNIYDTDGNIIQSELYEETKDNYKKSNITEINNPINFTDLKFLKDEIEEFSHDTDTLSNSLETTQQEFIVDEENNSNYKDLEDNRINNELILRNRFRPIRNKKEHDCNTPILSDKSSTDSDGEQIISNELIKDALIPIRNNTANYHNIPILDDTSSTDSDGEQKDIDSIKQKINMNESVLGVEKHDPLLEFHYDYTTEKYDPFLDYRIREQCDNLHSHIDTYVDQIHTDWVRFFTHFIINMVHFAINIFLNKWRYRNGF